jgi:prophage regulatory protein
MTLEVQNMAILNLPSTGFVRLHQIIGDRKRGIPGVLPIGRTTFLTGVKSGKYPKPVKLGERTVAWRVEDIRNLIDSMGGTHESFY